MQRQRSDSATSSAALCESGAMSPGGPLSGGGMDGSVSPTSGGLTSSARRRNWRRCKTLHTAADHSSATASYCGSNFCCSAATTAGSGIGSSQQLMMPPQKYHQQQFRKSGKFLSVSFNEESDGVSTLSASSTVVNFS